MAYVWIGGPAAMTAIVATALLAASLFRANTGRHTAPAVEDRSGEDTAAWLRAIRDQPPVIRPPARAQVADGPGTAALERMALPDEKRFPHLDVEWECATGQIPALVMGAGEK